MFALKVICFCVPFGNVVLAGLGDHSSCAPGTGRTRAYALVADSVFAQGAAHKW